MKALILAAGYGNRISELTNDNPKCLLPINNKPVIEYWIDKLVEINIDEIIINTHYLHHKVEEFVNDSTFKDKVRIVYEPILHGTAGTLYNCIDKFINDEILLLHADNFGYVNLVDFLEYHHKRPKKCVLTMLTFKTSKPHESGIVKVDEDNVLIDFFEKKKEFNGFQANGAMYIISKELIKNFKNDFNDVFDIAKEVIPKLLNKIYVYPFEGMFFDIGDLKTYNFVNKNFKKIK